MSFWSRLWEASFIWLNHIAELALYRRWKARLVKEIIADTADVSAASILLMYVERDLDAVFKLHGLNQARLEFLAKADVLAAMREEESSPSIQVPHHGICMGCARLTIDGQQVAHCQENWPGLKTPEGVVISCPAFRPISELTKSP